jgi:8-oxo-dGTP diphosphatase
VVLIRKTHPEWQAGKLNGVGGGVEEGETIFEAIYREFEEETGVRIEGWHHFASLTWEEGVVYFLRQFVRSGILDLCRTMTDELVERHWVHSLGMPGPGRDSVIPNLLWLVPLAAHRHDDYAVLHVVETGTTLRKVGRAPGFDASGFGDRFDSSFFVPMEGA